MLGHIVPDSLQGGVKNWSRFRPRWTTGTWIGRTDESEEHLLVVNGKLVRYRTVRRHAEADSRRWIGKALLDLKILPWSLEGRPQLPEQSVTLEGPTQRVRVPLRDL